MENSKTDENRANEEAKSGNQINVNKLKKTVSLGQNIHQTGESPRQGGGGNDSDSNRSSSGSGMFKINQRLLSKEVQERIKEEHEAPPITGNTLANYRNFKLKS
jgi:hypothetical protein